MALLRKKNIMTGLESRKWPKSDISKKYFQPILSNEVSKLKLTTSASYFVREIILKIKLFAKKNLWHQFFLQSLVVCQHVCFTLQMRSQMEGYATLYLS